MVGTVVQNWEDIKDSEYLILEFNSFDDWLECRRYFKKNFDPRHYSNGLEPASISVNRLGIEQFATSVTYLELAPPLVKTTKLSIRSRLQCILAYLGTEKN